MDPNDPVNTVPKLEVPKNTKGNASKAIITTSLGPDKKFLSDSIIMFVL
jgi:hypothetical protein